MLLMVYFTLKTSIRLIALKVDKQEPRLSILEARKTPSPFCMKEA
jgi:hypothetical protein